MNYLNSSHCLNLGDLVRAARGTRSLREFAEVTGVSFITIHKAEKNQCCPSLKTLLKLTSREAEPQNNITCEDLATAAGYSVELAQIYKNKNSDTNKKKDTYIKSDDIVLRTKNVKNLSDFAKEKFYQGFLKLTLDKLKTAFQRSPYNPELKELVEIYKSFLNDSSK